MIWIDSSFAIEWLLNTDRVVKIILPDDRKGILSAQYAETCVYFHKRLTDPALAIAQLEALVLETATRSELQLAAALYRDTRGRHPKASLADAMLAAVAIARQETVFSFDTDFAAFGFIGKHGVWRRIRIRGQDWT